MPGKHSCPRGSGEEQRCISISFPIGWPPSRPRPKGETSGGTLLVLTSEEWPAQPAQEAKGDMVCTTPLARDRPDLQGRGAAGLPERHHRHPPAGQKRGDHRLRLPAGPGAGGCYATTPAPPGRWCSASTRRTPAAAGPPPAFSAASWPYWWTRTCATWNCWGTSCPGWRTRSPMASWRASTGA